MERDVTIKNDIIHMLNELPPESLHEVQQFLDSLHSKWREPTGEPAVALGGLLKGYRFTEEDISQARREMWGRVDENTQ